MASINVLKAHHHCCSESSSAKSGWVLVTLGPCACHAGLFEKLGHTISRIEHARLDGAGRNSNQIGKLRNGFVTQVIQVDNLSMRRRKLAQAVADDRPRLLLDQRLFR